MSKTVRYQKDLPKKMYSFFVTYQATDSIPSFVKFAEKVGLTVSDLEGFRSHKPFDKAYVACCQIQRDILTDRALTRKFDPSFVKFLLSEDMENAGKSDGDNALSVTVEVLP